MSWSEDGPHGGPHGGPGGGTTSEMAVDMGAPPPRPTPPRHRKRRVLRRILLTVLVLAIVGVVAGTAFLYYVNSQLGKNSVGCTACGPAQAGPGGQTDQNVLVLGSDTRAILDPQDQAKYDPTGADKNTGQRADVIAVIHVDGATGKAVLVSIPRDLWVPTPKGGHEKINAFFNSGVSPMVAAVEQLTGLTINHYVAVNFDSFRSISQALGGVDIRFAHRVYDKNSGLNQPAGCNTLEGDQALAFVRDRDTDSDYGRIARQQLFVQQMMKKVLTPGTLLNPFKVTHLIDLGLGNLTHDSGLTLGLLSRLALKFHSFSSSDIDFRVLPSAPNGSLIAGQSVDTQSPAQVAQSQALFAAIKGDSPLPDYGKQSAAPTASPSPTARVSANPGASGRPAPTPSTAPSPSLTPAGRPVTVASQTWASAC
ncbi:MAG TPA: LCP family protein [Actinomycetota bacterium]|nr:LCP family protein [Actinomycetota bacterium]